jgi:hypothetical protein
MAYAPFEAIVIAQVQPLHVARHPADRRPQPAGNAQGDLPQRRDRVFAAGAAILCYMATSPAEAHDASHPELDGWYEKLESGKGPCCDGSNSVHVEPSDWETQNRPRSHYKVRLDGVWADVPDEAVVTGPNRDGRTLVWYYDGWTGHSGIPGKVIKCFMPGTMT